MPLSLLFRLFVRLLSLFRFIPRVPDPFRLLPRIIPARSPHRPRARTTGLRLPLAIRRILRQIIATLRGRRGQLLLHMRLQRRAPPTGPCAAPRTRRAAAPAPATPSTGRRRPRLGRRPGASGGLGLWFWRGRKLWFWRGRKLWFWRSRGLWFRQGRRLRHRDRGGGAGLPSTPRTRPQWLF